MNQEELMIRTKLSSVSLHALNDESAPIGSASGCIIKYADQKYLLTVSHATLEAGRWGVQLEYDADRRGIKYYCPEFSFLKQGSINLEIPIKDKELDIDDLFVDPKVIDFSYAKIPTKIVAYDEYIDLSQMIKYFSPKIEIETSLTLKPTKEHLYSFYGHIRTDVDNQNKRILLTPKLIMGMKYVRPYGDYYRFALPETIKDPRDYKGCSGAPILDEEGNIVSLVTSGYKNTNVLLGINLSKFKVALDVDLQVTK